MTDSIQVLTSLQQFFLRPGYLLGSTENADTLLSEAIDNSLDENLNGFASRIDITTNLKEGWYRVQDNGRGLPLQVLKTTNPDLQHLNGEIQAKLIFVQPNSSGKYDKSSYRYSRGSNGLGSTCIFVFSTKTIIRVRDIKNIHGGKVYELTLSWDKDRNPIYEEKWLDPKTIKDFWWNTEVAFWPNPEVFDNVSAKVKELPLQVIKKSDPKVDICINGKQVEPFSFKKNIEENIISDKILQKRFEYSTFTVDLSFAWCSKNFSSYYRGTVNLGTSNEGIHINSCKRAIGLALQKLNPAINVSDAEFGLRMFVDSLVSYPKYTGQTKEKLSGLDDFKFANAPLMEKYKNLATVDKDGREINWRVKEAASQDKFWKDLADFEKRLSEEIYKLLKEDEKYTEVIITRLIEYKKSINQLSDENYINSLIKTGSDKSSKTSVKGVIEATSSNRRNCELFICEGKSAGGSIKSGRNKSTQALFELRGKPMNVASSEDIKDIVDNFEIRTVLNAIGIGMRPYTVKIEDARYGKIIIATDADADGEHIQGLLLGALCYLCPEVFTAVDGDTMVYIAQAPLYKQGEKFIYKEKGLNLKKDFKRFKGLGSMVEADLVKTIVDPQTRILKKITLDSSELANAISLITSSAAKRQLMIENGLIKI